MNKRSILIVGSFAKGAVENYFADGFSSLGQAVHKFEVAGKTLFPSNNYIEKGISKILRPVSLYKKNEELLKFASNLRPDVILVFKGMEIFPDTLQQLREMGCALANYNPDSPFIFFLW